MTVALLLAAAPDRLSAMTRPYRRPGDRVAGSKPRVDGMDGRLVAVGVRQIKVAMCADAADGLRAVAATARSADDAVLVCASERPQATPTTALAMLLSGPGTAALAGSGTLLVARDDLPAVAKAADALAARIASGQRQADAQAHRPSLRRMHRRTRVASELSIAVRSLIEDIDGSGVRVTSLAAAAATPARDTTSAASRPARPGEGRPGEGLLAALVVAPLADRIARWAAAHSLTPNALTGTAFALAGCAAAWFAAGTRSDAIIGAVLLCVALPLRQARARLAEREAVLSAPERHPTVLSAPERHPTAAFGSWLESALGALAEYGVYAGLAAGWTTARPRQAWEFATAAMIVLALRQMTDACYGLAIERRPAGPVSAGHRLLRLAGQSIALPSAERTAAICLTAPLGGPRLALSVLLGWGVVAFGYSLAERGVASRVADPLGDGGDGGERAARTGTR
ncbi:MAG TPA: hypothetical protein VGL63_05545 [Streptosporangiaceae bacterium]